MPAPFTPSIPWTAAIGPGISTRAWGALASRPADGLSSRSGVKVVLFDPVTGDIELVAAFDFDSPHLRLNDGKVGPDGAFWVGSVHEVDLDKMQPIGALYRVGADGSTTTQVSGLKASNGLAWSADGTEMFHSNSCGPWIDRWRFAPETGEISGRQRLARPGEPEGRPDGGATDMLGTYWSAGTSAGVLNRYERSGRLLEKIRLPVPRPTMPCFGGAGHEDIVRHQPARRPDGRTARRCAAFGCRAATALRCRRGAGLRLRAIAAIIVA